MYPVAPSKASQVSSTTSGAVSTAVKFLGPPPEANPVTKLHEIEKTISKTNNPWMAFGFIIRSPLFPCTIIAIKVKFNKTMGYCENKNKNPS
jgi:hypothetical protein